MIGKPINLAEFMKQPNVSYSLDRPNRIYESSMATYAIKSPSYSSNSCCASYSTK
jgi:hypothetical protein